MSPVWSRPWLARSVHFRGSYDENTKYFTRMREPGKGWGVKCIRFCPEGTDVGPYGKKTYTLLEKTAAEAASPSTKWLQVRHGAAPMFVNGKDVQRGSLAAVVNFGCGVAVNCAANVKVIFDDTHRNEPWVTTTRDIRQGEWLAMDYGYRYDEAIDGNDLSMGWMRQMRYFDELPSSQKTKNMPFIFEEVVARFLTTGKGVRWELRRAGNPSIAVPPVLKEKLTGPIDGQLPAYAEMEVNMLYKSVNPNAPSVDMVFKNDKGTLICIQVSWDPDREVKASAFQMFCHAVGLCADKKVFTAEETQWVRENVLFVFCPPPRLFGKAKLTFKEGCILRGGAIVRMGDRFTSGINEDGDSS